MTPSQANFVWCRRTDRPVKPIYEELKRRQILVRYMNYGHYGDGLRISVGTDEEDRSPDGGAESNNGRSVSLMTKFPKVIGLLPCKELGKDPTTGQISVVGLFQSLTFRDFPTPPQAFTVYVALYDGAGNGKMK